MHKIGALRIAYFAEIFPHLSETWVHHEIQELEKAGCVVRVFATHPPPKEISVDLQSFLSTTTYLSNLPVRPLGLMHNVLQSRLLVPVLPALIRDTRGLRQKAQVLRDLVYTARLIESVKAFQPHILFAHFAGTRTNLAMFSSFLSGIPFSFKMHSSDVFNRVALFQLKMERAARVVTISDYNIAFIKDRYPDVDSSTLLRHPCGVPTSVFVPRSVRPSRQIPKLVSVGRLVRPKGFDVLIKASRYLIDRGVVHEIVILGDGPERSVLERLIKDLHLDKTVRMAGYASPIRVREEVVDADIFLMPCRFDSIAKTHDGLPVALIEAMALGVPVVSTEISAIPELIENGVTGVLARPGDAEALAVAIMGCLALEPGARKEMVTAARRKVELHFDAKVLADRLKRILASAVRASGDDFNRV